MRKKTNSAQSELLFQLWNSFGGVAKVAHLFKLKPQIVRNWADREGVPLSRCGEVLSTLNLRKACRWGLNYKGMKKFYGEEASIPSWEEAVKLFDFSDETTKNILELKAP